MTLLAWLGAIAGALLILSVVAVISLLQADLDEVEDVDPLEEDWLHG